MRYHFLQPSNIDAFFNLILNGAGEQINKADLDNFILLLPSESETKMFKDRLIEFNLESFDELKNNKNLKRLDKVEELMIKIISKEELGGKAKIL
jgi:hypothetical protein